MRTSAPKIGEAFAEWMVAQDHHKDHAADTPFRFSGVMGCARAMGYQAAKLPETDPMDGSSLAITAMGSLLHEDIQKAVGLRWPKATFEGKGVVRTTPYDIDDSIEIISGHYDIDLPEDDEIVEIKTVGAYKFDLSIGLFRSPGRGKKAYIRSDGGKGPSKSHICQAGMNALAHGRSNVRIVYLSREAVSVQKAKDAGLGPVERFWGEWAFGTDVWLPLVEAEIANEEKILALVQSGILPDRADYDDNAKLVKIVDTATHWRCSYCPQATRCLMDGPGRVPVEISSWIIPDKDAPTGA